jgi:hypothetical protein
LSWSLAGNTAGFGDGFGFNPAWIGGFTGAGRSQLLVYAPGDQYWWLGTISTSGTMTWKSPGNTKGFGNTSSDPTWAGSISSL